MLGKMRRMSLAQNSILSPESCIIAKSMTQFILLTPSRTTFRQKSSMAIHLKVSLYRLSQM